MQSLLMASSKWCLQNECEKWSNYNQIQMVNETRPVARAPDVEP